jgi:cyclophilin family peptidyl-prolyl cis-trans isomerase
MVRIAQRRQKDRSASQKWQKLLCILVLVVTIGIIFAFTTAFPSEAATLEKRAEEELKLIQLAADRNVGGVAVPNQRETFTDDYPEKLQKQVTCPYMSLSDLTATERYPVASKERHMVTPPADGSAGVALICCETTVGPWNILVHNSWAPIGARRFLDMVESAYFDTTVPLMRCVQNFLCQFGLNGVPDAMKPFHAAIPDDPNWLPEGPTNRENELGVKRFQKGYMAYAGAGKDSRTLQIIVALHDNGPLAGGSPWEVPWGELVGEHSYETLSKIYTGYGEDGPKQGLLYKADALKLVKEKFPQIDYVNACRVVDREGGER